MTAAPRVAIVSDTVDDINGVALGLRRLVAASRRAGYDVSLIGPSGDGRDDVVRVPAAMTASLPFYPDMTWAVPELPALVTWLADRADVVQLATPGPMGVAGLIAGRMLRLPVIAQYHTEVADFTAQMTGIAMLRGLVEPLVGWFYRQVDLCLAPSMLVSERLAALGIAGDRVCRIRRGVDLNRFSPAHRDRAALGRYGVGDGRVVLYVGRLSNEKNIDGLLAAWSRVAAELADATLLVVGEGPRAKDIAGERVVATGPLRGDELATVFASADVFAFASETETFGNVVVEAAASGLPAVVSDKGASREHVVDGVTGRVADSGDPDAFARAVCSVLSDPAHRHHMAVAARNTARRYDLNDAVHDTWALYRTLWRESPAARVAS